MVSPGVKAGLAVAAVLAVVVVLAAGISMLLQPPSPPDENIPTIYPYANDLAGAMDQWYVDELDYYGVQVDEATSCEMAVLVVTTTQPYDMSYYALRTFQYNGIGEEGRDNGLLVVVATDDKEWRVEVGYGLEGILPDTRVNRLAEAYLEPNMTAGQYGEGLVSLCFALGNIILNEYEGETAGPSYPIGWIPLTWPGLIAVAVVVIVLTVVTRGRILWPLLWILSIFTGGRGGFGGGRSGGGGAGGRW